MITSPIKKSYNALARTLSPVTCLHDVLPSLDMFPDGMNPGTWRHTWLFDVTLTYQSTDFQIAQGVVARVVPTSSGQINFGNSLQLTWRSVEECYSPWSPWWSNATALAGYATLMMMIMMECGWKKEKERKKFSYANSHALKEMRQLYQYNGTYTNNKKYGLQNISSL